MNEHTEQTATPAGAVPARIDLEDFIEAVTRGVTRALAAQDEVSGYLLQRGGNKQPSVAPPPIQIGIFPPPTLPGLPDLTEVQATFERG